MDARTDRAPRARRSGVALDPGTDLVVQLHMQPSGAPETVQPSIGFFFSDAPPTRTPTILRLGSQGIDIAPGEARYVVKDSYVLPVDVELHAVQPHAHYRLREARGTATFPDGTIAVADRDRRLGLPLAARLSLRAADPVAERDARGHGVPLRQLRRQRTQSATAAAARAVGAAVLRRDGRPVVSVRHRATAATAGC